MFWPAVGYWLAQEDPLASDLKPQVQLGDAAMNIWKTTSICLGAALVTSIGIQTAWAGQCHDQPNMAAALSSLVSAKSSLERAEHNKGGWRDAAMVAVNNAIAQVKRGCAVADGK
jgi:hypothetical protein